MLRTALKKNMEAPLQKTAHVRLPTSHLMNNPSKTNKACRATAREIRKNS